ncbi:MAG: FtsH protease activity modulator HflK [Hahellaceae bacterium]|nr:FtsH protease activity modulator HflK [Hahellaceae bacterium]
MAWNEPGGNNQDPWGSGRKGRNEGPPDLDEVIRKGLERLNALLGGKKGSGGSGGSSGTAGGGGIFAIVLLVIAGLLLWNSMYRVDEKQRAVVLRLGKYHTTEMPGFNWRIPFVDQVFIEEVTSVRNQKKKGHMLTEDENIVDIDLTVQFVINDLQKYLLQVRDPLTTLDFAIDSALRHEVGGTEMDQVLTEGREVLAVKVEERLQRYLDFYGSGILLRSVSINAAQPPAQVKAAFEDVQRAKEDEQKLVNQAESYRNKVVPESRGSSQRIIEEANAYKSEVIARAQGETERFLSVLSIYEKQPDVTRERMYLDTMQRVLSNTSKVMIDQKNSNNILYLPIDRMMSPEASATGASAAKAPETFSPQPSRYSSGRDSDNPLRNRR